MFNLIYNSDEQHYYNNQNKAQAQAKNRQNTHFVVRGKAHPFSPGASPKRS